MLGLGEVARGTQTYAIRPPEEVSQYQLGGVVRGVVTVAQLSRFYRPRANPNQFVIVHPAHIPDSLCDLPSQIKLIWIGCEGISECGHKGTPSPDEPNHHWR